jgi:hypothetical protein
MIYQVRLKSIQEIMSIYDSSSTVFITSWVVSACFSRVALAVS